MPGRYAFRQPGYRRGDAAFGGEGGEGELRGNSEFGNGEAGEPGRDYIDVDL